MLYPLEMMIPSRAQLSRRRRHYFTALLGRNSPIPAQAQPSGPAQFRHAAREGSPSSRHQGAMSARDGLRVMRGLGASYTVAALRPLRHRQRAIGGPRSPCPAPPGTKAAAGEATTRLTATENVKRLMTMEVLVPCA